MFAPRVPAETLRRLWAMLAHSSGGLLNASRLATSLGISSPTVARCVDLLVDLFRRAVADLGADESYLVYPGDDEYAVDGATVIGLERLVRRLRD